MEHVKQFLISAFSVFILFPLWVFIATLLWNSVLVDVVTWANPITFWKMMGLMVLLYTIWPGTKYKMTIKDDEK